MILPAFLLALSSLAPGTLTCASDPIAAREEIPMFPGHIAGVDSVLAAAYDSGITWEAFRSSARVRRAAWMANWESARVPADALAQARALTPGFRLLVIAVDSCSDSVNTIPYLAKLVAEVPGLGMRIVSPAAGRGLMATRPTPDGRPATPTVLLLNAQDEEVGCWIERPAALQAIAMEARAGGGTPAFAAMKQGWYDADAGDSTIREVVALLVDAAAGKRGCDAAVDSRGR